MENSITRDYVTEKVYDGLMAGCIPIYLGAPNIEDYVPDSNAIINYARLGSPEALKAELERLAADQESYEQKLLWKTASQHEWTAGERIRRGAARQCSACATPKHEMFCCRMFAGALYERSWVAAFSKLITEGMPDRWGHHVTPLLQCSAIGPCFSEGTCPVTSRSLSPFSSALEALYV